MIQPITKLAQLFDTFCTNKYVEKIEHYIVNIALVALIAHLLLIFAARTFTLFAPLAHQISINYLAAVATPFTVILLFEIFLLILTIPSSITRSIGRQYEIISLIIIRDVFHAFGEIENVSYFIYDTKIVETIGIDMIGGALMFLLVTVFYHIKNKRLKKSTRLVMKNFILLKKASAVLLGISLLGLLVYYVGVFVAHITQGMAVATALGQFSLQQDFFLDFFTLMVFVDVLILIVSYRYTADFEIFWRNSGFVISTILIRFSLTLDKPFDIITAIIAMLFGISTLLTYNYFRKIHTWKDPATE